VPKDPGQTICSRIGDCKDVATLMITMLRKVGIESYYVLVKTNDYFRQRVLPSLYFNHAIVGYYLDNKLHFLDMTTDFYPYYILPSGDANAWALLIKDGEKNLIRLPNDKVDPEKNKSEFSINVKLLEDRSAEFMVNAVHRGSRGGAIREEFSTSNKEEQKNYILDMMGAGIFENLILHEYNFTNMKDISTPLKSTYSLGAVNYCDRVSSLLVFRIPYMTPISSHPAILSKTRANALDVSQIIDVEPTIQKLTITFPKGYLLMEMPEDVSLKSKFGTYKVTFKKTAEGLYVEKFQSFSSSVIDVEEFGEFKKYYQKIFDIDSTKIALKKNKS
jgi:hypothetical protein